MRTVCKESDSYKSIPTLISDMRSYGIVSIRECTGPPAALRLVGQTRDGGRKVGKCTEPGSVQSEPLILALPTRAGGVRSTHTKFLPAGMLTI